MFAPVIFIIFWSTALANNIVKLPYGSVEGTLEKSRAGRQYVAFRGVKYAEALRFEDAKEPKPWTDIRPASKFSDNIVCPQINFFSVTGEVIGDEDCLFANIYTPSVNSNSKLPILVWFHGGGYAVSSGNLYGPEYLMDRDLILATPNYRLNVLGFLRADDEYLSGNYGMKDQVEFLKWVKSYISLFGGDPTRVSIAGSSSGAASVNWHMYSPMSQGLFHQAILESGTARSIWAQVPKDVALRRAQVVIQGVSCNGKLKGALVGCLKAVPASKLVAMQKNFNEWNGNPCCNFGPVVASESNKNAFVTVSPWNPSAKYQKIPLLIGFTSDEGGFTAFGLLANNGQAIEELGKDYREYFPIIMQYKHNVGLNDEAIIQATEKIRNFYFQDKVIDRQSFPEIKHMLADSHYIYDTIETVLNYDATKYVYRYAHRNTHSFAELEGEKSELVINSGPVHGDDLISLFSLSNLFEDPLDGDDLEVSKLMINMWANFVITGNPNNPNEKLWKPADKELRIYNIDTNPKMENWEWRRVQEFWKSFGWH